jgi:flagellar M-ring protein FliF
VIVLLFFLWNFRGCVPGVSRTSRDYQNIYTNLELKDTANVIARLKELKIPYEAREKGTTIAVPKSRADEARLALAEKNLPAGGLVGWEIFNETRMGATDFDRRIQLIRAISGELSRNIRRIEGVEDARVQVVLPETKLFEAVTVPVTAAVLLKLSPGAKLKVENINGIVHLVASSVENLKPENVTVVDEGGNILSAKGLPMTSPRITELITAEVAKGPIEQQILKKEEVKTEEQKAKLEAEKKEEKQKEEKEKTEEKKIAEELEKLAGEKKAEVKKGPPRPLTSEEKRLLKLKAREEYERQLNAKAQEILNTLYPLNSVIVRVTVELGKPQSYPIAKLKIRTDSTFLVQPIKKIKAVILVDDRVILTGKLKDNTYQIVAGAIDYLPRRGDRIIIKRVPFRSTLPFPEKVQAPKLALKIILPNYSYWIGGGVLLLIFVWFLRRMRKRPVVIPFEKEEVPSRPAPTESEAANTIGEIKNLASREPQKLANLLRKWLTEE